VVGVFVWVRFVTSVSGVRTCPHPSGLKRGEGVGRDTRLTPWPNIPQKRGGADKSGVSVPAHIPRERGGAGNGRHWFLAVVVVIDEHRINRDRVILNSNSDPPPKIVMYTSVGTIIK